MLKVWNKGVFKDIKKSKKNILKGIVNIDVYELICLQGCSSQDFKEKRVGQFVVKGRGIFEAKGQGKMSKRRGLQFKIFHQVANGRRNKKIIISLENEDGATLVGFFEKFYVRPLEDSQKLEELDWSPI